MEETSILLRLPIEIRRHIYDYLLPFCVKSRNKRGVRTVWHRSNTAVLATTKQIHAETTDILYGSNIFEIDVSYGHILFQFRRQLPSGLVPRQTPNFPDFFAARYRKQIRNVLVNIDHVDSYTGESSKRRSDSLSDA